MINCVIQKRDSKIGWHTINVNPFWKRIPLGKFNIHEDESIKKKKEASLQDNRKNGKPVALKLDVFSKRVYLHKVFPI